MTDLWPLLWCARSKKTKLTVQIEHKHQKPEYQKAQERAPKDRDLGCDHPNRW
jgi:hypothetical protein